MMPHPPVHNYTDSEVRDAFQLVLEMLWDGTTPREKTYGSGSGRYICHSLQFLHLRSQISDAVYRRAVSMIHAALGNYTSLEGWLYKDMPLKRPEPSDQAMHQAYRKAWLEQLITAHQEPA